MSEVKVWLWKVDEFQRMLEAGILTDSDPVELLEGRILEIIGQSAEQVATIQQTAELLHQKLEDQALIRIQQPITLPPSSQPRPALAVVRVDPDQYLRYHPRPGEIFLLVEVADSILDEHCQQKVKIYAKARIPEYWILDVQTRQAYMFRTPEQATYQQQAVFESDKYLSPLAFSNRAIQIQDLFPATKS